MSVSFILEDNNYAFVEAQSPVQAQQIIKEQQVDLILLDMNYSLDTTSGDEGLDLLRWLAKHEPNLPAVAMTAWSNVELAVKSMQIGASDFIEKPWKNQRLLQIIAQQLALAGLKNQNQQLKQRLEPKKEASYQWQSPCMVQLISQLESVASADVSILLTGDNGTGKSQMAKHIHQLSHRCNAPFISVNMGAISESLFESEMFGHTKGAFTDAKSSRIGRFELAQAGTLFLDEIANIPMSQQAKLLRVVESGEFEVLGSSKTQSSNCRFISASNGEFEKLISEEKFREDLFYRLNTLEFRMPSLNERTDDIIPLAQFFISQYAQKYNRPTVALDNSAKTALLSYPWPGNIRELSHVIERAILLHSNSTNTLNADNLPLTPQKQSQSLPFMTLEQAEVRLIEQALATTEQNIPKAAQLLGLTKSSLYRRIEKYEQLQK
ncbi:sigma-54-dependent Fis family transcriptional regulator [Alteromonadales bacterium alter-6D02]|nr:sigma-54-dependent Fis family transcriptional regulator [Alteromonadales bacterium alter-6D02]